MSVSGGLRKTASFVDVLSEAIEALADNFSGFIYDTKSLERALGSLTGISKPLNMRIRENLNTFSDLQLITTLLEPALVNATRRMLEVAGSSRAMTAAGKWELNTLKRMVKTITVTSLAYKSHIASMAGVVRKQKQMRGTSFALLGPMFSFMYMSKMISKRFYDWAKSTIQVEMFLEDLNYVLQDIGEILFDVFEPVLEVVVVALEMLADWLYEQPDAVKAFLLGMLAIIPILISAFAVITQFAIAIFALEAIGGIAGLISTLTGAISLLGKEVGSFILKIPGMERLFAKLTTTLVAHGLSWKGVALSAGLAIGMFLIGIQIGTMISGLSALTKFLIALIPILIAAGIAAAVLWTSLTFGAALPFIAASAAAAAGIIVGAVGLVSFQDLAMPTEIRTPTLAMLHPKEVVSPGGRGAGRYVPKEPPMSITVDVTGLSTDEAFKKALSESIAEISERMERKYRMREY